MDKLSKENQELSVELDKWIDENTVDGDFICHPDFIYDKLLEMESKLKQDGWIEIDSAEDVDSDTEVLLWDGCDHSIDYVDVCAETGRCYFANGSTDITHYKHLTKPTGE